jgi:hypothetical protein
MPAIKIKEQKFMYLYHASINNRLTGYYNIGITDYVCICRQLGWIAFRKMGRQACRRKKTCDLVLGDTTMVKTWLFASLAFSALPLFFKVVILLCTAIM